MDNYTQAETRKRAEKKMASLCLLERQSIMKKALSKMAGLLCLVGAAISLLTVASHRACAYEKSALAPPLTSTRADNNALFENYFSHMRTEQASLAPDRQYLAFPIRENRAVSVIIAPTDAPETPVFVCRAWTDIDATKAKGDQRKFSSARIRWMKWVTPTYHVIASNRNFPKRGNSDSVIGDIIAINRRIERAALLATPFNIQPPGFDSRDATRPRMGTASDLEGGRAEATGSAAIADPSVLLEYYDFPTNPAPPPPNSTSGGMAQLLTVSQLVPVMELGAKLLIKNTRLVKCPVLILSYQGELNDAGGLKKDYVSASRFFEGVKANGVDAVYDEITIEHLRRLPKARVAAYSNIESFL